MEKDNPQGRSPLRSNAKNSFHEHVLSTYHKNALNLSRSQKQSLTSYNSSNEQNTKKGVNGSSCAGNKISKAHLDSLESHAFPNLEIDQNCLP
jgi:hypothetical protein